MILAGDIGGTNSRMAIFTEENGHLHLVREKTFPSRGHKSLEEIIGLFVGESPSTVSSACLGIAGPVLHSRVTAANLPWIVDAEEISRQSGIATVRLMNDLEAHATGINDLTPADLVALNAAPAGQGNAALIAAGTGLGETGIYWNGARGHAFAGEGGHADFAPRNDLDLQLLQYLMKKFGHVSCERVLSGPGLKNIYDFLRDSGTEPEPVWLKDELDQAADPAALIAQRGLEARAAICDRALDIFVGAYGAEAGNLALRMLATGGVFLSGGIAAKILPRLQGPVFLEAFMDKGRMKSLLKSIPVKVIVNDRVGLLGAARYAISQSKTSQQRKP